MSHSPTTLLDRIWCPTHVWNQAIKSRDTLLTVTVVDPVIRVLFPTVLTLRLSPNVITLLSFGIALASARAFFGGQLILGGALFLAWYVADCIDGKVARVTDRCSKFGQWLDVLTDRIGTAIILGALAVHFERTDAFSAAAWSTALLVVWLLGTHNSEALARLAPSYGARQIMTKESQPGSSTGLAALRERFRLGPWMVHDIEWMTFGLLVGPLFHRTEICLAVATLAIGLRSALQTAVFWWRRRAEIAKVG